ncbi:Helix-loop-helix DNA-binding domain protein [Ancylostoma caninum]|uniref:GPI inositol-deacylase n=1 Tax=Ancylostoma caninum TaxID=29170 RepID=A0A368FM36_ANCCA|nr:Helix-loop-helix DNA-binding domain protein [Ancylostoma caninum]
MMNKTEMTSAPFRMHFYAVDFDEELSFLSGSILNRQRDFVVRAISTIQKMYSHKIVLIGHSLGGTVLHALPAHPRFNISDMGLIIILASPISAPPIVMDEAMISFYGSMKEAWVSRKDELSDVGLVSYSGGSKDFQVPDHLATIHDGHHIVHRPSWSIRGVDTPVDHLCILWCNQLARHSTRILYNYGVEEVSKDVPRSANAVVWEFFREESRMSANNIESLADPIKIGIFDYPWVSRVYRGAMNSSKKFFELEFISPFMVYSVLVESPCEMTMLFIYSNSLARSATAKGSAKVMTVDLPYGLDSSTGHIALEGKKSCEFDLTVRPDVFYAWYLLLISNLNLVIHFTFSVLVALTLLEKLKSFDRIHFLGRLGYYLNSSIAFLLFLSCAYNYGIRECVFAVTIFYLISSVYFIAELVRYVRDKIFCAIPLCLKLCNAVLALFVIVLSPVNAYLANSAIALLIALGGMDDDSDFDDEQLESPQSSQSGSVVGILDGTLDDPKRHARAQHNALERRRRDNIKDMYISLKDVVPDMQNERASRAVILRRAIEVIEEKQQQRADLKADCDRLRSEMAELEREVARLRENLAKPIESNRSSISGECSPQPASLSAVVKMEPECGLFDVGCLTLVVLT